MNKRVPYPAQFHVHRFVKVKRHWECSDLECGYTTLRKGRKCYGYRGEIHEPFTRYTPEQLENQ